MALFNNRFVLSSYGRLNIRHVLYYKIINQPRFSIHVLILITDGIMDSILDFWEFFRESISVIPIECLIKKALINVW